MSSISQEIRDLSADQLELLQLRLKRMKEQKRKSGPLKITPHAPGVDTFPLSYPQEQLWFRDQLDPGSTAYNQLSSVRFKGDLDISALAWSIATIISRHEVLRTTLEAREDGLVQVVASKTRFHFPLLDLSSLPAALRESAVRRGIRQLVRQPIDMARGPLLHAALWRLAGEEHVLAVIAHHVICDGSSFEIFNHELTLAYRALVTNRRPVLPELPVQYGDFAAWQRHPETEASLERGLDFWAEALAGAPPSLELPTDRPRPKVQSERGDTRWIHFEPRLATELRALSEKTGATLFMILMSAFQVLMSRLSGQREVVIGTDVANRTRMELEPLIGFFSNQMIVRGDLGEDPTFEEWIAQTRRTTLDGYAYQHVPYAKVVERVQPERNVERMPIFQVMCSLQRVSGEEITFPGLELSAVDDVVAGTAKLDLVLVFVDDGKSLSAWAEYLVDLFDATTVQRFLRHYEHLLETMVAAPQSRLSEAPPLPEAERHQLLVEWNDSAVEIPAASFDALFAEVASRRSDELAVRFEGESLSYGALADRAARLAGHLRSRGVVRGDLVALFAERGIDFLTAMLAVFRAGAAYVPLDPLHPPRRLAQVLRESGASPVLAVGELRETADEALASLDAEDRPEVIVLEAALEAGGDPLPHDHADAASHDRDLAYVIYTSGSTGTPKGAMVEHGGMLNHLQAKIHDLDLEARDVVAQTASQCFDISVWQFLAALLVGGRVQVYPDAVAQQPRDLLGQIERDEVSILETVPSLLRLLIEEAEGGAKPDLRALRFMIPTGEALPPQLSRRWLESFPHVRLVNAYGPTECSDDVTHQTIAKAPSAAAARVPIGRPVDNTALLALDERLLPVPFGSHGALHVAGAGVGRGYLGDPARTAATFLPNPFEAVPGARLYRTGDLGRFNRFGELDFLGRVDRQVKWHGYRIELGEIEAVLRSHSGVAEASVLLREEGEQERLVGYVVADEEALGLAEADAVEDGGDLDHDKVDQWRTVFDEVLRVWVDSYSGDPMPEPHIVECVDDTVERILALEPRRVLELGCGTGLLLMRIAPHCEAYWGSDLSPEVVSNLEKRVAGHPELPEIHLLAQAADDFEGIPRESFDVVILNEIVQYFPSAQYLVETIEGALERVVPGGYVFVGGVRNHALHEAFSASVQLRQTPPETGLDELRRLVRRRMGRDKELLVDPELWPALVEPLPTISRLGIQLKGGCHHNELTRFRYDVVLQAGGERADGEAATRWLSFNDDRPSVQDLRRILDREAPARLGVRGIVNGRLAGENRLLDLLAREDEAETEEALTAARVLEIVESTSDESAIDPADFWELGRELPYQVDLAWSDSGPEGRYDVLFTRRDAENSPSPGFSELPRASRPVVPRASWGRYSNNPQQGLLAEKLVPRLREHLRDRLPDYMVPSSLILLDAMPLTSNGKLDRRALPAPEERHHAETFVSPRSTIEETLSRLWAEVLQVEKVGIHDSFFELGGDSILGIQFIARANQLGLRLTPRQMFQYQTIAELAEVVGSSAAVSAEQGRVEGEVPLGPIHHWFFEQKVPHRGHWNWEVASLLALTTRLDPEILQRSMMRLVDHHDGLRLRYERDEAGSWRQLHHDVDPRRLVTVIDQSRLPEAITESVVEAAVSAAQRGLDFERGPLLRAVLLERGKERSQRLFLLVHHILVDGLSWRLLLEDLTAIYRQLDAGETPKLPAKTTSFKSWSERLVEHARSGAVDDQLDFWLDDEGLDRDLAFPVDFDEDARADVEASTRLHSAMLDEETTRALLQESQEAYQTRIDDLLRTALVEAFASWTGKRTLLVDLESHGREYFFEDIDLSRTVGWFTAIHRVRLDLGGKTEPGEAIRAIKEQLRRIPNLGVGYGLLRYLRGGEVSENLARQPRAELLFNYLGQFNHGDGPAEASRGEDGEETGTLLVDAPEGIGSPVDPRGERPHLLQLNVWISGGQLRTEWNFSRHRHRRETIERLAQSFLDELTRLVNHCLDPEAGGFTPSDFPEANLDQDELDLFMSKLSGAS